MLNQWTSVVEESGLDGGGDLPKPEDWEPHSATSDVADVVLYSSCAATIAKYRHPSQFLLIPVRRRRRRLQDPPQGNYPPTQTGALLLKPV
jgi:hypothetical protein